MAEAFSVADVGYVHRIIVGNDNPEKQPDEEHYRKQTELLNRCLSEFPKGKIIAQEKFLYPEHRGTSSGHAVCSVPCGLRQKASMVSALTRSADVTTKGNVMRSFSYNNDMEFLDMVRPT